MNSTTHDALCSEVRYAERLCQRTARLYRRLQAIGVFGTVVGGSAALSALNPAVPAVVSSLGALAFTLFGAALLAIRPADKAAMNESDVKRYAKLRAESHTLDTPALQAALDKARESDTAEVEALRDVAWNDVAREIGCPTAAVPLNRVQRLLAAAA